MNKLKRYIMERTDTGDMDSCWNWNRSLKNGGYGQAKFKNKKWKAHRLSWTAFNGDIPEGKQINHRCHNPACCNPSHCYIGTQQDNMNDMVDAGRCSKPNPVPVRIDGKEYSSYSEAGRKFGIAYNVIYYRVNAGWEGYERVQTQLPLW